MAATVVLKSPLRFCNLSDGRSAKRFAPETQRFLTSDNCVAQDLSSVMVLRRRADAVLERYQLYETVLQVYSTLCKGKVPVGVHFADAASKRRVCQLVFEVLHHSSIVEEILNECGFYARNFDLHGHESLVMIMTYDFQKSRFSLALPHEGRENIPETVVRIAEALWQYKIKLSATLARMRVRANAQTITQLLPKETTLTYEQAVNQFYYTRVNLQKVTNVQMEVISVLGKDGYTQVTNQDQLRMHPKAVYHAGRDLLAFSADCREFLSEHTLVKEGHLIEQDLGSYTLVENLRHCLQGHNNCGDVILTNCNAGLEAAHIANLAGEKNTVLVFGAMPEQVGDLQEKVFALEVKNVQFIQAPFISAAPQDHLLANVTMVVCLPPSSLSAISHPLDFVLQEGDQHLPMLLGQNKGCIVDSKTLMAEQMELLTHALTFHQARHIVYATRSVQESENGALVQEALERHKAAIKERYHVREFALQPSLEGREEETEYYATVLEGMYKPGPAPKEVIERAVERGILSGEGIAVQKHIKKPRKKVRRIFSRHEGIPMTIAAQKKVVQKKQLSETPTQFCRTWY